MIDPPGSPVRIGKRIAHARRARGLSHKQLARVLGVRVENVSRWENGWVSPRTSTLREIALFLKVSTDWLLEVREPMPALRA